MNRHQLTGLLLCFLLVSSIAVAQPCLTGWNYRVPVTISNSNGSLSNHQVMVVVNTADLIANAKMQISGGDIRFLNETASVLPHWVESGTMNTSATRIWVKVDAVPSGSSGVFYMFYGNSGATTIASGDDTFELFDGFEGTSINGSKWSTCGTGSATVSAGNLSISTNGGQSYFLEATSAISSSVIIEAGVATVSQGTSVFGLVDGSNNGYGVGFEENIQPVALMKKITPASGCFSLSGIGVSQDAKSAGVTAGVWSFSWHPTNNQFFDWPGNAVARETRTVTDYTFPSSVFPVIGQAGASSASMSIDWVGVRKHATTDPSTALGTEATIINEVTASASATACSGESLQLFAEALPGAVFSWSGPNLFSSNEQNPVINPASAAASGTYTVTATVPANCFTVQDQVVVNIDAATVPGTLEGATTVCSGANSGTVVLRDNTGDVIRWETSANGDVPWISINETSTTLPYNNLVSTAYYRAVVKNGTCGAATSNAVAITIDQSALPGNVIGGGTVCIGENSGTLRLNDYTGTIIKWERKALSEALWTAVNTTSDNLTFQDLEETTDFRAVISGGTCGELRSGEERVIVAPLPKVAFSSDEVCLGVATTFINESTISTGTISSYQWSFDDGSASVINSPKHVFPNSSNFDVRLTAVSDKGCTSDTVQQVVVNPTPEVDFFTEDVCQGIVSVFEPNVSLSQGNVSSYNWTMGDGSSFRLFEDQTLDHIYEDAGEYQVKLLVRTSKVCFDSAIKTVTVHPRANLEFEVAPVFKGEMSIFQNNSSIADGSLSYNWLFGDGGSSTLASPRYTYQEAGEYEVRLSSTSSIGGCVDTLSIPYEVKAQVLADFDFEPTCRDIPAVFINNSITLEGALSFQWNFGDGTTSDLENPEHQYVLPGQYTVKLTAVSEEGSIDVEEKVISVYSEPSASFTASPACGDQPVSFNNLTSILEGSLTYTWNLEGNTVSTEVNPLHQFSSAGDQSVLLTATSANGCIDSVRQTVVVRPLPVVNFTVDTACLGQPSLLTNLSSINSGSIESMLWDFGDGTNSIIRSPSKTYQSAGEFDVTLRATSDLGCAAVKTVIAKVVDSPVADFDVNAACFQQPSLFVNATTVDDGLLTYSWDFGDGASSTAIDPEYTYALPGQYSTSLTAISSFGCEDRITKNITVHALPNIQLSAAPTVSPGIPTTLEVTGAQEYFWEPGTGLSNQLISNPVVTIDETTVYTVTGTDDNGCTDSDEMVVTVEDDFIVVPTNTFSPDGNGINDTWFIDNIVAYDNARVSIFNSWGEVVFQSDNYQNEWDGMFSNDLLPAGNYYYVISNPEYDRVYKGTITLLRAR